MTMLPLPNTLAFAKGDGLLPVIVQDATSLRVLMLGYMNEAALAQTQQTGFVTFFSRSKQRLWQKGESSGHVLKVRDIRADCDQDTLLILADPAGPTCHTGQVSCFGDEDLGPSLSLLAELEKLIAARHQDPTPDSYTSRLFAQGVTRIAQKVGEEGVETALAAATGADNLADEAADLVYHLIVLLQARDLSLSDVLRVLAKRRHHGP